MIEVRLATLQDIHEAYEYRLPVFHCEDDLLDGAKNSMYRGRLYTLVGPDQEILGVIGGVMIWTGVASLGSILTTRINKYPVAMIRTTRKVIGEVMDRMKLHRVEMAVKADYGVGHRWAKALGFEVEGLLKKYSSDQSDFIMYGKVK